MQNDDTSQFAAIANGATLCASTTFLGADNAKVNGTPAGSDTDNGYEIGVKVPMDKWEFSLGFANQKTSGDDKNQTVNSYGVQALYSLNKMVLRQFHCEISLAAGQSSDSIFPA